MKISRKWISVVAIVSVLPFIFLILLLLNAFGIINPLHRHEHCILQTGIAFGIYAQRHGGKLPSDPNGFGDALLLLVKEHDLPNVHTLVGVDDDGHVLTDALANGTDVPESKCTRIYVQGLTEEKALGLAIFFDKYSTPGGDHFRTLWGPKVREVWRGSLFVVKDEDWPKFAKEQIEQLVKAGIPRRTAEAYYAETLK